MPASSYDVEFRATSADRSRPGRAFLTDDALLVAPSRHGRFTRAVGGAANALFANLPEELGLYDPHAVNKTEAIHDPETLRIRYRDVTALAPFVRPTGFSLHLHVEGRADPVRLVFRSATERQETVELGRALKQRAEAAGADVALYDPGGRTKLLSLDGS